MLEFERDLSWGEWEREAVGFLGAAIADVIEAHFNDNMPPGSTFQVRPDKFFADNRDTVCNICLQAEQFTRAVKLSLKNCG